LIDACPAQSYFLHEDADKESTEARHSQFVVRVDHNGITLSELESRARESAVGNDSVPSETIGCKLGVTMSKLNTFCAPRAAVGSSDKAANRIEETHIVRTSNKLSLKIAVGYVSPFIPVSRLPRPCGSKM
jgi:hypothetical protein